MVGLCKCKSKWRQVCNNITEADSFASVMTKQIQNLWIVLNKEITGFTHLKSNDLWDLMLKRFFRHNLLDFTSQLIFMDGLYLENYFWALFLSFYCFFCCYSKFSLYLFLFFVALLGIIFLRYSAFWLFMFLALVYYFLLF